MPKFLKLSERLLGSKTITEPGVYNAIDDSLDGYSAVDVQIQPSSGDSAGLKFAQSDIITSQIEMDGMPACLFHANIAHGDVMTSIDDIGTATITIGGTPVAIADLQEDWLSSMGGPEVPAIMAIVESMDANPAMMAMLYVAFGISWQAFDPFTGNMQYTEDPSIASICGYCAGVDLSTGEFLNPAPVFDAFEVGPPTVESAVNKVMDTFRKGDAPAGYNIIPEGSYRSYFGAGLTFREPVYVYNGSLNTGTFMSAGLYQGLVTDKELYVGDYAFAHANLQNTPVLNVPYMYEKSFYYCRAGDTRLNFSGVSLDKDCLTHAMLYSVNSDEYGVYDFGKPHSGFYVSNTGFGNASRVYIRGYEVRFTDGLIRVAGDMGSVTELNILSGTYMSNTQFNFWFSGNTSSLEKLKAPNNILKNPGISDLPSDLIGGTPYNLKVLDVYDLILEVADYNNLYNLETLVIRNDQSQTVLWAISDIINLTINSPISQGSGFIYVPDNLVDTYKSALVERDNLQAAIRPLSEYVEA